MITPNLIRYPADAFDRNLALKPSLLLIGIMFYCALPLVLVLLAYNPSPKLQTAFEPFRHFATPFSVVCGLPAALVIAAWAKRLPSATKIWVHIWKWGKWLLSLSLASQILLLSSQINNLPWAISTMTPKNRLLTVQIGLALLSLYYLWRIRRVSDVFADFPAAPDTHSH